MFREHPVGNQDLEVTDIEFIESSQENGEKTARMSGHRSIGLDDLENIRITEER